MSSPGPLSFVGDNGVLGLAPHGDRTTLNLAVALGFDDSGGAIVCNDVLNAVSKEKPYTNNKMRCGSTLDGDDQLDSLLSFVQGVQTGDAVPCVFDRDSQMEIPPPKKMHDWQLRYRWPELC